MTRSLATLVCALGLAAGSAAARTAAAQNPAPAGMDQLPPLTMAKGQSPEQMFTPAKIAAVATISNLGEIYPSRLALNNSQNPTIVAFARQMVADHTRFEEQLRDMLNKKKMLEEDNALSLQLKRNAAVTLDSLRPRTGPDFDKAYVLQQIASHEMTLKTLDTSLIPLATDPDMKAMLENAVRPAVVQHLQRIKAIHDQMLATASR